MREQTTITTVVYQSTYPPARSLTISNQLYPQVRAHYYYYYYYCDTNVTTRCSVNCIGLVLSDVFIFIFIRSSEEWLYLYYALLIYRVLRKGIIYETYFRVRAKRKLNP